MSSLKSRLLNCPRLRRCLAVVVLVSYVTVALGVPLPNLSKRDHSRSSPAPANPCGCCIGADACQGCCCSGIAGLGTCGTVAADEPQDVRWFSGMSALRCQGQSTLWVTTGAVLPPPPLTWQPNDTCTDVLSHPDFQRVVVAVTPPDPPPRTVPA